MARPRHHEQAAAGRPRRLGLRAGERGREVVAAGQQQDGDPGEYGPRRGRGAGVGGQYRQVWMMPLPAAVARSNGQTWAVLSRATARARAAGRAASGVSGPPHGIGRSAHSVLACKPWLR